MVFKSPSNIALIKYMGKTEGNFPINPSLSYTLEHLVSGVEIELIKSETDIWESLDGNTWVPLSMSLKEQERFLSFFKRLKHQFNLKGSFKVRSGNNFPKSSGAASSASSFSALTQAVYHFALEKSCTKSLSIEDLALISRQGSGSSCRSFFSPWCLWDGNEIQSVSFPYEKLHHDLILCGEGEKKVSSSEAHRRVRNSPFFEGRADRARGRLKAVMENMKNKNWTIVKKIVKEEFEDMHNLFETSRPSFSYYTEKSRRVLKILNQFWEEKKDGPLMTMDAGPHMHLLYRPDQMPLRQEVGLKLSLIR